MLQANVHLQHQLSAAKEQLSDVQDTLQSKLLASEELYQETCSEVQQKEAEAAALRSTTQAAFKAHKVCPGSAEGLARRS